MQLKFYARSGKAIGAGRDLEEVYYALDRQFVSNMRKLHTSVCIFGMDCRSQITH